MGYEFMVGMELYYLEYTAETYTANTKAAAANNAATAANKAAAACENIAKGINSMTDGTTGITYTIGINGGMVYLESV